MTCLHLISSLFGRYLCLCVLFRSLAVYPPLCWHSDSIPKHSAAVHPFADDIQVPSLRPLRSSHCHIFLPFASIGPILRNLFPALLCYTILSAHLSSSLSS